MIPKRTLLAAALISGLAGAASVPVFRQAFDSYGEAKAAFGDTTRYVLRQDTFELAALQTGVDSTKSTNISVSLDPDSVRGSKLVVSAWTKASELTLRPNSWNGVKVMLVLEDSLGIRIYPQLAWPDSVRSWSWRRSSMIVSVPRNLRKASFVVGLELMAGKAWFDSLRIVRVAQADAPARDPHLSIPDFSPTRFRGAMIGTTTADSAAIREFGQVWKGNLLRWQLNAPYGHDSGLLGKDFDGELAKALDVMDTALPLCRKSGIQVVVDLHNLSQGLFYDKAAQTRLVETWKKIVTRFQGNPAIWGWDLANEPNEAAWTEGLLFWDELADTIAREIRKIESSKVIIVEPASGGGVTVLPTLKPLGWNRGYDIPKVVYSFHFYSPGGLTHQTILSNAPLGAYYPGDTIEGAVWDSAQMRRALRPAYDFQARYRVPMYVGEFSCIRWAPNHSAYNWLKDATRLFEEAGWDWSYHAYREFHGWSVEYSDSMGDMKVFPTTDRKALLLSHFARNEDPYGATVGLDGRAFAPTAVSWHRVGRRSIFVGGGSEGVRPRLIGVDGRLVRNPERLGDGWIFRDVPSGIWRVGVGSGAAARTLSVALF